VNKPMIVAIPATLGPFDGFKEGDTVTLSIRGLPDQCIPVFADEAAVYKWAVDRIAAASGPTPNESARLFPDEQEGYVFYVGSGTRGIITGLKNIEIDSRSWVESAEVQVSDGSNRQGWVSTMMIFNPELEKLIDEQKKNMAGKK
jgi:hypothetical protein